MNIIVSAGGTGGHINPALALINEFKKQEKNCQEQKANTQLIEVKEQNVIQKIFRKTSCVTSSASSRLPK